MKTLRSLLIAGVAIFATATLSFAADPSGDWTWSSTGPKGRTLEATAHLQVTDGKLAGSVKNRAGEVQISDTSIAGDQISFNVVREMRKRRVITKYTGKIDGDVIQGTVESTLSGDKALTVPWSAKRVK